MTKMRKNIAVIGCGYWGKNLVRNFYELNSLYAICDIDDSKLKPLQEKYPVEFCSSRHINYYSPLE